MNGFFKVIGVVTAVFTAVLAALAVYDKISNKNRIKGDYLDCEVQ